MLLILARLLGKQIAESIAETIRHDHGFTTVRIGWPESV
jgi:hypothetical protein